MTEPLPDRSETIFCDCPGCDRPAKWRLLWGNFDTRPRHTGTVYACGYHKHSKPGTYKREPLEPQKVAR